MHTRRSDLKTITRLLKRADFLRVQASGQKWVTPTCIVQMAAQIVTPAPGFTPARDPMINLSGIHGPALTQSTDVTMDPRLRGDDKTCRYGLTVPKKIWPRAVDRNRVRRRVRAVLLGVMVAAGEKLHGRDLIVLPRAPALKAPIAAIEKDLTWAMKRLTTPVKDSS